MVFGRRQRGLLPTLPKALERINVQDAARKRDKARKKKKAQSQGSRELAHLQSGQMIRIQDVKSKRWDTIGYIIETRNNHRSYIIEAEGGKRYTRNRRYLRPCASKKVTFQD